MSAPADPLILSQRSRIVRFAVEHRIPAMYAFREFVSDGGLLSYGPHLMKMFRRSATYADRILNGAKPGATYIVDWIEIRRSLCMVGPPVR